MESLEGYLNKVFRSFLLDPADNNFQCGYLAAMMDVRNTFAPDMPMPKYEAMSAEVLKGAL